MRAVPVILLLCLAIPAPAQNASTGHPRVINTGGAIGPYSPAIEAGGFLFVSGQIAIDPASGLAIDGDIRQETAGVLDALRRVLASAGYDSSHIVSATVYLRSMDDFAEMNDVYRRFVSPDAPPARATVQVCALPRGARVEISVIARKP